MDKIKCELRPVQIPKRFFDYYQLVDTAIPTILDETDLHYFLDPHDTEKINALYIAAGDWLHKHRLTNPLAAQLRLSLDPSARATETAIERHWAWIENHLVLKPLPGIGILQ